MLKILIVEDELITAKAMAKALQLKNCEVVGIAHSGKKAIEMFNDLKPTFAFIDLELSDEISGIEVAEHINKSCRIPFIFLSVHYSSESAYFKRANATMPAYYLPKGSFLPTQLWHFVEVALTNFANGGNVLIKEQEAGMFLRNQFFIKSGGIWEKINAEDIISVTVNNGYCKININEKKGNYLIRQSLDNLMKLLQPFKLLRVHQSHAVNEKFIHQFNPSKYQLILSDNTIINIGKTYRSTIKEQLRFLE